MEKDWIKDLRTKMRDYDSPEPEGLWEDIAASLDRDGLSSGLSRKQHRGRVVKILSGFAAAAAVLLLALILWPQPDNSVDVLSDASGQGAAEPEEIVSGTELPGEEAAVDALAGDVMSGQWNPDAVSVSKNAKDVSSESAVDTQSGKHSREGKAPIDVVKKECIRLLGSVLPRQFSLSARFGFEDPYHTGQLLAGIAVLYPFLPGDVRVEPYFEERIFRGKAVLRGRLYVASLVFAAFQVLRRRAVRETYRDIRGLLRAKA